MDNIWELSFYHVEITGYTNKLYRGKPSDLQVFDFLRDYLKPMNFTLEALSKATDSVMLRNEAHLLGYTVLLNYRCVFNGEG